VNRWVERIGEAAVARQSARLAERIVEAAPGVQVSATPGAVVIEGRGLRRDGRLRWIAGLLK
jgi:hypothetical protein